MAYKWKQGSHINVNADIAGEVCESLASKGNLTGKSLVDVSRPAEAPLHPHFEWDDAIAAERYREEQGCHIIRCLTVTVEPVESKPVECRAFFVTTEPKVYEPVHVVMESKEKTENLLTTAIRELQSFKRKYSYLSELAGVFAEINKLTGGEAS